MMPSKPLRPLPGHGPTKISTTPIKVTRPKRPK
jgi:hypothetical protein